MTYLKEQNVFAWSHWNTPGNGGTGVGTDDYIDCDTILEGVEDVTYFVVQRTTPGWFGGLPYYIVERAASRQWLDMTGNVSNNSVWCLDSAVLYSGAAATAMTGLHHMAGATALVYADGSMQAPVVVAADGTATIGTAASSVLIGFGYTPQLQTLRLDLGEPSVQGKRKKVANVSIVMEQSRGITVAQMRDDIDGNSIKGTSYPLRERVSNQTLGTALPFITGIRRANVEPGYQIDGSVFIEGTPGLPNTILAVIPTVVVADDPG